MPTENSTGTDARDSTKPTSVIHADNVNTSAAGRRFWGQIREHKVVQWTLVYAAGAYTLLHIVEMVGEAFDWPHVVARAVTVGLFLGVPVAATLAWYHGYRALHRVSGPELSILAVLLFIAGSVLWFVGRSSGHQGSVALSQVSTQIVPAPGAAAVQNNSIAVLPFTDMSEKHDQEYFADGMAEEVIDVLTGIPQLAVMGRTSSFQFKGRNEDLRTIGSKLGANYVVEGSVRRAGQRVRVTAQLISTHSGLHLWSGDYDRDFNDVLVLQHEIATAIGRALQLVVTVDDRHAVEVLRNADAYTFYLRGRFAFDRGDVPSFREAQRYFEQALEADPGFVRAAEGLLLTYQNEWYAGDMRPNVAWPLVAELSRKILQQDSKSAFTHSELAWLHFAYDYDWQACNREIDFVIASKTRDPIALVYAGYVAGVIGRHDDAARLIQEALVLDPLNPDAHQGLGGILLHAGDYPGAISAYRKSLAISPTFAGNHVYIGEILLAQHQDKSALSEIETEAPSGLQTAVLSNAHFALGHRQKSDALLETLIHEFGNVSPELVFYAYAFRHENDQAFTWLGKAYAQHDVSYEDVFSPYLAYLHGDPRWKIFLRKMNVPE